MLQTLDIWREPRPDTSIVHRGSLTERRAAPAVRRPRAGDYALRSIRQWRRLRGRRTEWYDISVAGILGPAAGGVRQNVLDQSS
jgi:hypothetical protein